MVVPSIFRLAPLENAPHAGNLEKIKNCGPSAARFLVLNFNRDYSSVTRLRVLGLQSIRQPKQLLISAG